jgi:hypothetical protein
MPTGAAMATRTKLVLAALALAIVTHGEACATCPSSPKGYTVHHKEAFNERDASGHQVDKQGFFHLVVGSKDSSRWMANARLGNASVCVAFSFPEDPEVQAGIGLTFWRVNSDNFHLATVTQSGIVTVWRFADGAFTKLQDAQTSEVVGAAPDPRSNYENNTLEAIITGNRVQIILNDTRFISVEGTPPKDKWNVGLYASPYNGRGYDAVFYGVTIIELP